MNAGDAILAGVLVLFRVGLLHVLLVLEAGGTLLPQVESGRVGGEQWGTEEQHGQEGAEHGRGLGV